ncbi:putative very short patch repair endonuclease [Candidatus Kuenenia stuttgartiensis]|uniref:Very short patch repair endonuclease n=1 Tax=Kuenenia stuttgartiensis TaxID=174633 RepID=A0A6G7GIN5_KUEST|nr:DNA mismatch endonuclease Vsr [Candidatus Kuenenia stuttgartiensis]QII09438.1 putative very short patch repair endonuclease [Candidatus Kuenenia stuttgartiensis]
MADIFTKKKRSQIMASVSRKETKPEILVRKFLFNQGYRYRKNVKTLPGKPDIVLPKYKTVIFVHGCFWHGHKNCKAAKLPETRKEFWANKIKANILRDKRVKKKILSEDYNVITVWQCQLKNKARQQKALTNIVNKLQQ